MAKEERYQGHEPILVWVAAFCKNWAVLQKSSPLNIDSRVLLGRQYFYGRDFISYYLPAMKNERDLLETM
jgi:hypothetical protein